MVGFPTTFFFQLYIINIEDKSKLTRVRARCLNLKDLRRFKNEKQNDTKS
nr:MAG TPA: hypothetical protein [Caudoviricetes sp.]